MASQAGLHSLGTIIKRLEAATSRLEDIALAQSGAAATNVASGAAAQHRAPAATTAAIPPPVIATSAASTPAPAAAEPEEVPESVIAYDEIVVPKLKEWLDITRSFAAPSVQEQAGLVEKMFANQRALLLTAAACSKPDQNVFAELLKPLLSDIEAITKAKETYRKERDWANHFTTIAEGAPVVGWVTISPKPGPHVQSVADSMQYWGNRIIQEFKNKDTKHVDWVKAFRAIFDALQKYVMQFHTTGITWNPKGISAKDYQPPSSAPSAGGAPAPPPPPPPAAASPAPAGGLGAVFADLNKGESVVSGLRKVDKSEMTHKNPELRAQGPLQPKSPPSKRPALPRKPQSLQVKKPSKFVLEGSKWLVEYYEGETVTVNETENNQTVNIFGCKSTTVIIKGKVNAVTLVNCTKTSILVESVISSVSVTSSPSFVLQITGAAPTLLLDNTDSGQVYLSPACLEQIKIFTAKCSAINISLPVPGEEEGIFDESPVPEQFCTEVKDGKLVTTVVEHKG